jgi:hypothetical protein
MIDPHMSASELMRQAEMTAHDYMVDAVRIIDEHFCVGYAAEHPELVGAFMRTAVADFQTAILIQALGKISVWMEGLGVNQMRAQSD